MKAVNLIPADLRRGGGASHSGFRVYVLLGGMAAAVAASAAFVVTGNLVSSRRAELSRLTRQTSQVQRELAATRRYTGVAGQRAAKVATVTSLAASRFDWEGTMRQVARVLPANVWLTSLVGTVNPQVQLDGVASGDTGPIRNQVSAPALEIVGCTTGQGQVAGVLARLRLVEGVDHVTLAASEKNDSAGGGGSGSGSSGGSSTDCRNGSNHFPRFELVVFFKPQGSDPAAAAAGATAAGGSGPSAPGAGSAAVLAPASSPTQPVSAGGGR